MGSYLVFSTLENYPGHSFKAKFQELRGNILKQTNRIKPDKTFSLMLAAFKNNFLRKWQTVSRQNDRFMQTYSKWLDIQIKFKKNVSLGNIIKGRAKTTFNSLCERSKRRRVTSLRSATSTNELAYATQMCFRAEGNIQASNLLKEISQNPEKTKQYYNDIDNPSCVSLNSDEALSLLIEADLSKSQYNFIRNLTRTKKCNFFPSYEEVLKAKKKCYPEGLQVTSDTEAEVALQSLINRTCEMLARVQEEVTNSFKETNMSLTLVNDILVFDGLFWSFRV